MRVLHELVDFFLGLGGVLRGKGVRLVRVWASWFKGCWTFWA